MPKQLFVPVLRIAAATVALASIAIGYPLQSESDYSRTGPFPVETVDSLTLEDHQRGTDVEVRVYYPAGAGPFPIIAFSHSLGANKDIYSAVSRHWASHGYVTVHPTHDDSGIRMGPNGMQPSEDKVRNRLGDVTAALDGLDQIERDVPDLAGKLDASRMAVAGHSYGSFITMLAGGITVSLGPDANVSLGDPRVRCVLPISPSGRGDYGMSDPSWDSLTIPALFITGTRDQRNGRAEDWRMEPFEFSPAGDKHLIVIEGARHGDFGGDAPGDAPTYVKAASAAFWDSCLNGAARGRAWLESGFAGFAGPAATITSK